MDTYFEELNTNNNNIITGNDDITQKSDGFDRDYEKMMEERKLVN